MSLRKAANMLVRRITELDKATAEQLGSVLGLLNRDTGYDRRDAAVILRRLAIAIPANDRETYEQELADGT